MANSFRLAAAAVDAAADAVTALLNGGTLRIYSGSQPRNADAEVGGGMKLAEVAFGTKAFGAAVEGVATASAILQGVALRTGKATWFRALTRSNTAVYDGSVGTAGADLNLKSTEIQEGAAVLIGPLSYTHPKV